MGLCGCVYGKTLELVWGTGISGRLCSLEGWFRTDEWLFTRSKWVVVALVQGIVLEEDTWLLWSGWICCCWISIKKSENVVFWLVPRTVDMVGLVVDGVWMMVVGVGAVNVVVLLIGVIAVGVVGVLNVGVELIVRGLVLSINFSSSVR